MRLNPKLQEFISNKIPSSAENPYFLWDDDDSMKLEEFIISTATSEERKEDILTWHRTENSPNCNPCERKPYCPYEYFREVKNKLLYNSRTTKRRNIELAFEKLISKDQEIFSNVSTVKLFLDKYLYNLAIVEKYSEKIFG